MKSHGDRDTLSRTMTDKEKLSLIWNYAERAYDEDCPVFKALEKIMALSNSSEETKK